jgi:putative ABC transport system permease protein
MTRWAFRNLKAHTGRLILTVIAISIGVAFVAGTFIFTDTLQKAFNQLTQSQPYDVEVSASGELAQDFRSQPELPSSLIDTIAQLPEVGSISGNVQLRGIEVLDRDGAIRDGFGPRFGVGWVTQENLRQLRLIAGNAPVNAQQVAIDETNAKRLDYRVGDQIKVATPLGVRTFELTGIFDFGISASFGGATITAFDLATARGFLNEPTNVSTVLVDAAPGVSVEQLRTAVAEVLPVGTQAVTNEEAADELRQQISNALGIFNTILLAFAGIALVVGSFIIANTFTMLVAQRARELALLRAIGASRKQITTAVLTEAGVLGLVSSLIGVGLGVGLAFGLRAALRLFGVEAPFGGLIIAPRTIAIALAVGVSITLLVAWLPAKRAGSMPPVAAMRDDVSMPPRSLRCRVALGLALLIVSFVAGFFALQVSVNDSARGAQLAGVSAAAGLFGFVILAPSLVRPVIGFLGAPFSFQPVGKLARENNQRNPRRTAATASALMIGLALITALATLGASLQVSVSETIDEVIGADLVLSPAGFGTFSPEVQEIVRAHPNVTEVAAIRSVPALIGADFFAGTPGEVTVLSGVDPDAFDGLLAVDVLEGDMSELAIGKVAIDAEAAEQFGLALGDTTTLTFSIFPLPLEVVAIYERALIVNGFLTSTAALEVAGVPPADSAVFAKVGDVAQIADTQLQIKESLTEYPGVEVVNQAEFKEQVQGQVDQLLALVTLLIMLAVIVAFVGVVNTLALGVIERTREIGLLRAIGMARRQIARMVVIESFLITLFGLALGLLLGLVYGVLLQQVLKGEGLQTLAIPAERIGIVAMVIAVAGVIAAIWPARRASRLNMLRAIASE